MGLEVKVAGFSQKRVGAPAGVPREVLDDTGIFYRAMVPIQNVSGFRRYRR
jgi:hypothetical protein